MTTNRLSFKHATWCDNHIIEEETDGSANDVCRAKVTIGPFVVDVEDSPAWPEDERHQIVPPDLPGTWVTASDARDLAAALVEAARIVEERSE